MRAWKLDLLAAALRRAGFTVEPAPIIATPAGTRRRIDLALRRQGSAVLVGLHAPRSAQTIDLLACPVLDPRLFALIGALRKALRRAGLLRRQGSAVVNLLDDGPDLLLRTDAAPDATDRARLADFARTEGVCRIAWAREGAAGEPETLCLLRPPVLTLSGVPVRPPPGAFLQASLPGEQAIVGAVIAALPERLPAKARVADLYAGCGTLTLALAARLPVAAFEGDAAAAACLKAAVNGRGLAGRVTVDRRDLVRQPLSETDLARYACVVLDPPHAGAEPQIARIAAARVRHVVYVSCNPAALSRDAALLRRAGYAVASAVPIDQFVWSARLESVVAFSRT
jgi:23S rRNA (uracil1939-C5)-methyltransferase